jgi:uncharacterized protein YjbI with pentapeptide repeats
MVLMADRPRTRVSLVPDCGSCFGLCCAALPFTASADFPVDKPAGQPCGNLRSDFGCGIHARLRETGWKGCTVFECFGAGQQVSQVTFGGVSWRDAPGTAGEMFAVLPVMRQLHEMLSHLEEALAISSAAARRTQLTTVRDEMESLTAATAEVLLALDLGALRGRVGPLLQQTSAAVRADARRSGRASASLPRRVRPGADLLGADLRGADLRGGDLRGAYLIAADLRRADLRTADLLGADLRDANLSDADLDGALFLTQPQVNAARGNAGTRIPAVLRRPGHWT